MKTTIEICEAPFCVEFDYKIHSKAYPATRDEPSSPMEFEIHNLALSADLGTKPSPSLEIPAWLEKLIIENLQDSASVYDEIAEDA